MNQEFFDAVQLMAAEKGIPVEFLYEKIANALVVAEKRNYNGKDVVFCDIDPEKKELNVYLRKNVVDVIDDEETIDAFFKLSRLEGIIPAIESSHAVAFGMKLAKQMDQGSVLINLSGRGDKDMDYIIENYGIR